MSLLGQAEAKPLNELTAPAQLAEVIRHCPFALLIAEFLQHSAGIPGKANPLLQQGREHGQTAQPSLGSHLSRAQHTQEDPTLQMGFGISELLSSGVGDLSPAVPAGQRVLPPELLQQLQPRGQRDTRAAQAQQEPGQKKSLVVVWAFFMDRTTSLHLCTSRLCTPCSLQLPGKQEMGTSLGKRRAHHQPSLIPGESVIQQSQQHPARCWGNSWLLPNPWEISSHSQFTERRF